MQTISGSVTIAASRTFSYMLSSCLLSHSTASYSDKHAEVGYLVSRT
jgi:hypothetical protein